jgi:hypothetical protein
MQLCAPALLPILHPRQHHEHHSAPRVTAHMRALPAGGQLAAAAACVLLPTCVCAFSMAAILLARSFFSALAASSSLVRKSACSSYALSSLAVSVSLPAVVRSGGSCLRWWWWWVVVVVGGGGWWWWWLGGGGGACGTDVVMVQLWSVCCSLVRAVGVCAACPGVAEGQYASNAAA